MLGEILGRIAGLGCVELLRFFPFDMAREEPVAASAVVGLGGTALLLDAGALRRLLPAEERVGVAPPSSVDDVRACRPGTLGRMAGMFFGRPAEAIECLLELSLELPFCSRISVAGVAGLFWACEASPAAK